LERASSDACFRYPLVRPPIPGPGRRFERGGFASYLSTVQAVTHVSVISPPKWRFGLGMLLVRHRLCFQRTPLRGRSIGDIIKDHELHGNREGAY
jgi:hypothetical protein